MKIKRRFYFPLLIALLVALALGAIPLSQPSTVYASPDAERQSPDVLLAQNNLSGVVADIQDDPDGPDANWLTAIVEQSDTECHVSFPTPTGNPTAGAGLQEFKIWVRKEPGTGTPTVGIDLYESGAFVSTIMAASDVTNETGELFSATWDAILLGTADGSGVECYIYGTGVSGAPAAKTTVEVGAVEWNVNYTPTPLSTAISIVGKVADTAVGTITFPEGAPDATVSDPYNDVDTDTDPQVLHASTSEPVVRLKNTSDGTLTVWLEITDWLNGVAVSEDYELVDTGTTTVAVVDDVLSANGNAATVDTSVTMATTTYKALYLAITLSSSSGASGTSTLTILGESV